MFANSYQSGFISIFFSVGSNPLAIWDKQVKNGHIRRVIDDEVKSLVLDIGGTNVATTYITCPIKPRASLGVKLPYFVMVIKNMKKYFSFEIQILDDKDMRRRFRVSNFQSTTKVRPFCTTMPIGLSAGWNQVQFNLADFTKRAYGSAYLETIRVQIHANVRIRRIYFTDQLHSDEDLPNEFKLFAPGPRDKGKGKEPRKASKEVLDDIPPIKTEPKPDEEMPPPPSPAEESPVREERPETPEGEIATIEEIEELGDVITEVEETLGEDTADVKIEGEEGAEGEPPAEESEVPAEGEGEGEGGEVKIEGEEGEAPAEDEAPAEEEVAPTESGEAPTEEEVTGEGGNLDTTEGAEGDVSPEPLAEETIEASETGIEPTEVTTDVTETEASPSDVPTTENEE